MQCHSPAPPVYLEPPEVLLSSGLSELPEDMPGPVSGMPELPLGMSLPPEVPELLPGCGISSLDMPPLDVPELDEPPGGGMVDMSPEDEVPPEVPPGGGVLAPPAGGGSVDMPGESEGGGVVVEGSVVPGVVVVPCSPPPPRLQAATLIVSKPSNIRTFEACSFGFIAIPFN